MAPTSDYRPTDVASENLSLGHDRRALASDLIVRFLVRIEQFDLRPPVHLGDLM